MTDELTPPYEYGPIKYRNTPWEELPPGVRQMLLRRERLAPTLGSSENVNAPSDVKKDALQKDVQPNSAPESVRKKKPTPFSDREQIRQGRTVDSWRGPEHDIPSMTPEETQLPKDK